MDEDRPTPPFVLSALHPPARREPRQRRSLHDRHGVLAEERHVRVDSGTPTRAPMRGRNDDTVLGALA